MTKHLLRGLSALAALAFLPMAAEACHTCKKSPCVMPAPRPAYQCVTEMVPYTVMQTRMRVDFVPQTCTVPTMVPETTYLTRTICVMKPIYDTKMVTRSYTVCRPVFETDYVTQTYTVCKPVTTTRQVTEYCMQPRTWCETVPVVAKQGCCGLGVLCGKLHGGKCGGLVQTGCQTVTRTCYTPVPVTRTVCETTMVPETHTRQVPVTRCRMVSEVKTEQIPVTSCRMVPEMKTVTVPVTRMRCEMQTVTRMVPVCKPECVPVTCYRPVTRMVPVCPPVMAGPVLGAPQSWAAAAPAASGQTPAPAPQK